MMQRYFKQPPFVLCRKGADFCAPKHKKALRYNNLKAWLGWLDLNQRMTESKSVALPLGYTPKYKSL